MRFQLPGNSRIHIRLFEPVDVKSECHRLYDIIGIETDGGDIDAICHAHASRFHRTRPTEKVDKVVNDFARSKAEAQAESQDPPKEDKAEEPAEESAEDKAE